mmetsp:Transcript_23733/g.44614  ORF Transcript_23733/g.44614 Transcript_23733/m.44614 type:complete len:92 (-) Transcript_23733:74-349(-)
MTSKLFSSTLGGLGGFELTISLGGFGGGGGEEGGTFQPTYESRDFHRSRFKGGATFGWSDDWAEEFVSSKAEIEVRMEESKIAEETLGEEA